MATPTCPQGYKYNASTGKCVLANSAQEQNSDCSPGFMINPKTGKCEPVSVGMESGYDINSIEGIPNGTVVGTNPYYDPNARNTRRVDANGDGLRDPILGQAIYDQTKEVGGKTIYQVQPGGSSLRSVPGMPDAQGVDPAYRNNPPEMRYGGMPKIKQYSWGGGNSATPKVEGEDEDKPNYLKMIREKAVAFNNTVSPMVGGIGDALSAGDQTSAAGQTLGGALSGFAKAGFIGAVGGGVMGLMNSLKNKEAQDIETYNKQLTTMSTIQSPNVGTYEDGGAAMLGYQKIQAKKGETKITPLGDVYDVKATKTHKQMKDDEVTDFMSLEDFIMSDKIKVKKDEADKIVLGETLLQYDEKEKAGSFKEIKLGDIMKKKKVMSVSDMSKSVRSTFKTVDEEKETDIFKITASTMNRESRLPYLQALKMLNISKMPKKEREETLAKMQMIEEAKAGQSGQPIAQAPTEEMPTEEVPQAAYGYLEGIDPINGGPKGQAWIPQQKYYNDLLNSAMNQTQQKVQPLGAFQTPNQALNSQLLKMQQSHLSPSQEPFPFPADNQTMSDPAAEAKRLNEGANVSNYVMPAAPSMNSDYHVTQARLDQLAQAETNSLNNSTKLSKNAEQRLIDQDARSRADLSNDLRELDNANVRQQIGLGMGSLARTLGILGQNPITEAPRLNNSYISSMTRRIPDADYRRLRDNLMQTIKPATTAAFQNTSNFSRAATIAGMLPAQVSGQLSDYGAKAASANANLENQYLGQMQQFINAQIGADNQAAESTKSNMNQSLRNLTDTSSNYLNQLGALDAGHVKNKAILKSTYNTSDQKRLNDADLLSMFASVNGRKSLQEMLDRYNR